MEHSATPPRSAHMPFMAVHGVEHDELAIAVFNARVLEDGLAALRTGDWATQATTIDLPGERIFVHVNPWGCREIVRQGLSRFLNLVDGLIGQGLRVLVLVTTNEEIRKLHPMVARPGRTAANVGFDPLSAEDATAWLNARGADDAVSSALTIAELYARLEGLDAPKQPIGFGGAGL